MSDPIKVTLSGNSTPLLQNPFAPAFMGNTQSVPLNGLVEADSRLAIEQGKGLTNSQGAVVLGLLGELLARLAEAENSRNIARDVAEAFRDTIRRATGNHDAVHGLMILCQSHKSLAEAEARAGRVEEAVLVTPAMLRVLRIIYMATDCSNEVYDYATLHHTQQRIADEMPRLVTSIGECYLVDGDGRLKDPMRPGRGFRLTPMGYEVLTLSDPLAYPVSDRRFYPAARAAVEGAQ